MPAVLAFNRVAVEERLDRAAAYLGIEGGYEGFCARVLDLRKMLAIPDRLSEMGVGTDRIDELTEMALEDPSVGGNPVEMNLTNTRALFVETI